jgi:ABC-type cobalamin/Fe3+-siderophores transport system ATPase subunit
MITAIEIEYIKGIERRRLELDIIPNRPSILVAPNGFGKSSLAVAFNSLNNNHIKLDEGNRYEGNQNNLPKISIEYEKSDGTISKLDATDTTNTIKNEFGYFVINNRTYPKGIGSRYGRASASLEIEEVVLIDRIPNNVSFAYKLSRFKEKFGANGKLLPNIKNGILDNLKLVEKISNHYQDLQYANGNRLQQKINDVIAGINAQQGTEQQLLDWIANQLNHLQQINYLNCIATLINKFNLVSYTETKSYLAAIQLIWLYTDNVQTFKDACTYNNYRLEKQNFEHLLDGFNCTWKNIRAKETHSKLVVTFPKATEISNGQRDILTFISMLFRARQKLRKNANILIIDEIFDYLDDANLIAAQYYITKFIDEFKNNEKCLYPLILTHLNPFYFKNYVFNNQRVYYLNNSANQNSNVCVNEGMKKLLRNRDNPEIKQDIDEFLFHYNTNTISKRQIFKKLQIPELWGEGNNFINYLNEQKDNYLNNKTYDPLAVCGALRIEIERITYNKLQDNNNKKEFINTHKTREKLEFAETKRVNSPETYYLLGIIYNEGMHWKDNNFDNISPIVSKLENLVIRKLIKEVFDSN